MAWCASTPAPDARRNDVLRLQRALQAGGDTRLLKRELGQGNKYAHAYLARRGLVYREDAIQAKESA